MNKLRAKVSIGMPVYNGARYLSEGIESLLCQTFDDFELIICDNASIDATEIICREFQSRDPRIRYYRTSYNLGAAANFNKTFELSSGQYFKWAAYDDLCAPEFIKVCVNVLDKDPNVVLAYTKVEMFDENISKRKPYTVKLATDTTEPSQRFASILPIHKCFEIFGVIRRIALKKTPPLGAYAHADGVLLSRLALLGRFVEIPEYYFCSRQHSEQSNKMARDYRLYTEWYDSKLKNKRKFPYWRMHFEFLRSIRQAHICHFEKFLCFLHLARWVYRRRLVLRDDGMYYFCQILKNFRGKQQAE